MTRPPEGAMSWESIIIALTHPPKSMLSLHEHVRPSIPGARDHQEVNTSPSRLTRIHPPVRKRSDHRKDAL